MRDPAGTLAGMILAAGYGERMLPLTRLLPKPLLPVLGVPLLEIVAGKLLREGASSLHVNVHHLPEAIEAFAGGRGWPVSLHREKEILGTAGGIGTMGPAAAAADDVLLHNGDVLADIPFAPALAMHRSRGALVTLVLVPSGPRANVAVANDGSVTAVGVPDARPGSRLLGYTGMAIISREGLSLFPRGAFAGLVDTLNGIIARRPGAVAGWNAGAAGAAYAWGDCGAPAPYLDVHRRILVEKTAFDGRIPPPAGTVHADPGATIEAGGRIAGFCSIGPGAVIARGAALEDCVVLGGTRVEGPEEHRREILFPGGSLKG